MSQDIVADTLNQIMNAKKARKKFVNLKRHSKFLLNILEVMKKLGYLDYKTEGTDLEVEIKNLNECKAVKPRYNVKTEEIEKYIRRFLPARDFGFLIVSTSKGLMTHSEAIEKNIGGGIIAYIY